MFSVFDVPFDQLAVEHVRAFLAEAEEEGVIWEAKADGPDGSGKRLRPEHVRNGVCGLANQLGGYFVVGAAQDGERRWQLVGVAERGESGLWLDRALRGLRPAPRYRHRVFALDGGRWAAVIEVEPLTQTPCMTADGQVFERVSSETVRVTDPARLAELMARGRFARENAEALAERAARDIGQRRGQQVGGVSLTFALAAASYEEDIGSRLFHSRFVGQLDDAFDTRLFREVGLQVRAPAQTDHTVRQSFVQRVFELGEVKWLVRAQWDGVVVVAPIIIGSVLKHGSLFDLVLLPAWRVAADLVGALGGYGDARAHLHIEARAKHASMGDFYRGLPGSVTLTRWCDVAEPDSDLIGSVQRELQRAAGLWSFEGSPDPPPGVMG